MSAKEGADLFLSKNVKIMFLVMVMVMALSLTAILFILAPRCSNCKRKFCFGTCTIVYDVDDPKTVRPNLPKTNQTTTRLAETERVDESYLDQIYFIGDSRTVALQLYGIKRDHIFAEEGLNHETARTKEIVEMDGQALVTISEAVRITAPDIMIVNFGVNGAAWMSVEELLEGYALLIDDLLESSPNSILIIEAVLPVSSYYEQESGCSNEKLDEINDGLYALARERGLFYLASNEPLKNEENDLIPRYSGDGLHYNEAAYEILLEYILNHAIIKK